jgi:hypothetical protein
VTSMTSMVNSFEGNSEILDGFVLCGVQALIFKDYNYFCD